MREFVDLLSGFMEANGDGMPGLAGNPLEDEAVDVLECGRKVSCNGDRGSSRAPGCVPETDMVGVCTSPSSITTHPLGDKSEDDPLES